MAKPKSRQAGGKERKVRLLTQHEWRHVLERLCSTDMSIFTAFVKKHMDESEAVQLSFYEERRRLWYAWNESGRLSTLLSFLLSGFCDLLVAPHHRRSRILRLAGAPHHSWRAIHMVFGCLA